MKLLIILLTVACLQVSAHSYGQISLSVKDENLEKVLLTLKQQSGYQFFYNESMLQKAKPVTASLRGVSLEQALELCFRDQPSLTYTIISRTVVIKDKSAVMIEEEKPKEVPLIDVKGRVVDENGQPISGASVSVKGSSRGTSTNNNGEFSLSNVDENAVLVISAVNIQSQEVAVKGRASINISVRMQVKEEEEIVVAYNKTTVQKNVSALTVVKGEQIQHLPNRSFDKSLQGLVPGLQITNGTGQPGGGVSDIILRGISTGTQPENGSVVRNPLIVIDGVPVTQEPFQLNYERTGTPISNPLAQFNPSDIESITVLKDASAIALYGSKASNGVILVTTKTGKAGKTVYNFRHQTDISKKALGNLQMLNREEYTELLYETFRNTNAAFWTDFRIDSVMKRIFPTYTDASTGTTRFYQQADWNGELYNDRATTIVNELSMSGGTAKTKYYVNLGWTRQDGVVKKTGYDGKYLHLSLENQSDNGLKVGINTSMSYNVQDYSTANQSSVFNFGYTEWVAPYIPIKLQDGSYYQIPELELGNPAARTAYNINQTTSFRGLTKFFVEYQFLKNFTFSSIVGIDFMLSEIKEKADPRNFDDITRTIGLGRITERAIRRGNIINTNSLRFNKSFGHHAVGVLLAEEAQVMTQKTMDVEVRGSATSPPFPNYDDPSSPGYVLYSGSGFRSKQTALSLFGQLNYSYHNRYFLSASMRGDGSSNFGEKNQWGKFWSVGAGWAISSESFMKSTTSWLNYLKLRGSIGQAGNSAAVTATTRYYLMGNARQFLGNTAFRAPSEPGNPTIQWEKTFNWDLGLETKLLKERLGITIDVYKKYTSNLIYSTTLPSTSGFTSMLDNIGNIENQGIEVSLSATLLRTADLTWRIVGAWSANQNKLVKANIPLTRISGDYLANEEGRNFNSYYVPVWAGVDPASGMPQWIDSSGKPTINYNLAKREFVGKPQPDGFGALTNTITYRNVDLSFQFYYEYGFEIFDQTGSINDGTSMYRNQDKRALDRWQKPGDVAANPLRLMNNPDGGTRPSTRFLMDGDYIRFQNISLSYNLPKKLLQPLHINAVKLFVQGNNLAIWTPFAGKDPDNSNYEGNVFRPYPIQRSYSLGININF